MPELPEVETIRRSLDPWITGKRIGRVEGRRTARIFQVPLEELAEKLPSQAIEQLRRRGKFLILDLSRHFLVFHLGMTGQLTFRKLSRPDSSRFLRHPVTGLQRARQHAPDRHTHFHIHFQKGESLLFRDPRQFGRVYLLEREDSALQQLFSKLGPEPLDSDFRMDDFYAALKARKAGVKSVLLTQSLVAGVGNIYADEALFESGIHPLRSGRSLRRWEVENLFEAIPKVLQRGIHYGGTTLRDYIDSDGRRGSNQERLRVYGRPGQDCVLCGGKIEKIVAAQRGTHFCPRCQPRRAISHEEWVKWRDG